MIWLWFTLAASTECVSVEGEKILMQDLARLNSAFAAVPPDRPVGLTPVPGVKRVFTSSELQGLAARNGVAASSWEPACVTYATRSPDAQEIAASIRRAFGAGPPTFELIDYPRTPVPSGIIEFPRVVLSSLRPDPATESVLIRGIIRYAGQRTFPIWARIRLDLEQEVLIAIEELPAGRPVESRQVRLEKRRRAILQTPSPEILTPQKVAGMAPRHTIHAGAALSYQMLTAPHLVNPGDHVQVEVASGAAKLSLPARAESGGRAGERILVRNLSSGKLFRAVIARAGLVVVDANGERKWQESQR